MSSLDLNQLQAIGRNAMEQAVIADLNKSMADLKVADAPPSTAEKVKLDAPFKLARARLESGEWLLKIELLDPALLNQFQQIVQRGANTFDMHELTVLRELVDGIVASPSVEVAHQPPTPEEIHDTVFTQYAAFQRHKEKQMPLPLMKFHMALGVAGELLELMEGFSIEDPVKARENIIEELGDMLFFLHGIRNHYGLMPYTSRSLADSSQRIVQSDVNMMLLKSVSGLVDLVKKDLVSEKPIDKSDFYTAVGNIEVYMSQLCKQLGIQMYDLANSNMDKLNKRYKDKFTTGEAQARADKAEFADCQLQGQAGRV